MSGFVSIGRGADFGGGASRGALRGGGGTGRGSSRALGWAGDSMRSTGKEISRGGRNSRIIHDCPDSAPARLKWINADSPNATLHVRRDSRASTQTLLPV
jgi:hypothetical protein